MRTSVLLPLPLLLVACTQTAPKDTSDTAQGDDTATDTSSDTGTTDSAGETGAETGNDTSVDTSDTGTDTDTGRDTADTSDTGREERDIGLTLLEDDLGLVTYSTSDFVLRASGTATMTGTSGAWETVSATTTVYSANLTTGASVCDFDVAITGTAAADPCPNCEFDFDVEGTVTRDASTTDCDYAPDLSFLDTADMTERSMRYVEAYDVEPYTYTRYRYVPYSGGSGGGGTGGGSSSGGYTGGGGGSTPPYHYGYGTWEPYEYTRPGYRVPEKFQSGGLMRFTYYYGGGYTGGGYGYYGGGYGGGGTYGGGGGTGYGYYETFKTIAPLPASYSYGGYGRPMPMSRYGYGYYGYYGYSETGSFVLTAPDFTWSYEKTWTSTDSEVVYQNDTCGYSFSELTSPLAFDQSATETLSCADSTAADVWTVPVVAGDTLSVTIDTVARRTAFAPGFWINAPDTCSEVIAWNNFSCTFGGTMCPAAEWVASEDGDAQIVVLPTEVCAASSAEYRIAVGKR